MLVRIDCDKTHDWNSFHDEFDRVFAFPDFYGRNMDAWVDCMSSVDDPEDALTGIHCEPGGFLTIELENVDALTGDRAEFLKEITDCVAFVNWRRIEIGEKPEAAIRRLCDRLTAPDPMPTCDPRPDQPI